MLLRFHLYKFEIPGLKLYFGTVNFSQICIDQVGLFFFLICSVLPKKQSVFMGTTIFFLVCILNNESYSEFK